MIHHVKQDDDLAEFTAPAEEVTHLWRTASMAKWHLAVPYYREVGISSPCGAGGVSDARTMAWRGGMVVALADIEEQGVVWQAICARCEVMHGA